MKPLRGRVQDGKDYDAQNKEELQKLITPLMFSRLSTDISSLSLKFDSMMTLLEKLDKTKI